MGTKEKVSALVEMGFTVDEAISLAKGNYRTVPDPKPAGDPEPEPAGDPEPKPAGDPELEPAGDPELKPAGDPEPKPWERIEQALAKLTQSVINSNINNKQQPTPMSAQDVLGLMLEPENPAERGK